MYVYLCVFDGMLFYRFTQVHIRLLCYVMKNISLERLQVLAILS